MATEIDPLITKCIKLLPIKTSQAAVEMKKLIFEAIAERTKNNSTVVVKEEPIVIIESTSSTESEGKPPKRHYDEAPKETEKATKRPKLMTQVSKSSSSSSKDSGATTIFGSDDESTDVEMEEEPPPKIEAKPTPAASMDEYADDIGLTCIVCRLITEEKENKLIQCQECQLKYHQNCHKPPLSKEQLSDPRLIWYCSKCTKNMKKINAKPVKGKPSPATIVSQSTAPAKESPLIKAEAIKKESPGIFSFKRMEVKPNDVAREKETAVPKPAIGPTGLARLAATIGTAKAVPPKAAPPGIPEKPLSGFAKLASALASKPAAVDTPSKAPSKPAPSSSAPLPLNPMVATQNAADKRLQLMKKKAAARLQPKMP